MRLVAGCFAGSWGRAVLPSRPCDKYLRAGQVSRVLVDAIAIGTRDPLHRRNHLEFLRACFWAAAGRRPAEDIGQKSNPETPLHNSVVRVVQS